MPATLRRHPARFIVLAAAAAALAMPAAAPAQKSANPLAGARLAAAVGSVDIATVRCPPGVERNSPRCGRSKLELTFRSTNPRATRLADGTTRIRGSGESECTSVSPTPDPVTLPDGSMQMQGPAQHVRYKGFTRTDLRVATTARGARWTWLEPTTPTASCDYFYGEGTTSFPGASESEHFGARLLRRERFTIAIAEVVEEFEQPAPDGGKIIGEARWNLRLSYRR